MPGKGGVCRFRAGTNIRSVEVAAQPGPVRLTIYNALGATRGARWWISFMSPVSTRFLGLSATPRELRVGSGVYLTRLKFPTGVQTRRLLYLK